MGLSGLLPHWPLNGPPPSSWTSKEIPPNPGCSFTWRDLDPCNGSGARLECQEAGPGAEVPHSLCGGKGEGLDQGPLGTSSHPILFHRLHIPF